MSQDESQNEVHGEGQIAPKVNWDEDFKPREKSARSRPDFLQLNKPGEYMVRLIGATYMFNRYWDPFDSKARIIVSEDDRNKTKAYKAGFFPRETCAVHVIDRATGKIMLLEKSKSFFKDLAAFKKINKISPADPQKAPDFVISVNWKNGDKRQAEYTITATFTPTPITESEKALFESVKCDLGDYYKSTSLSKIDEAFDALPAEKKIKPPKPQNKDGENNFANNSSNSSSARSSAHQPAPIREVETSSSNDAFGDDSKDETSF